MATTQEELNKAVSMVRQLDTHIKGFEKEYKDVTEGLQGGIDDESKEELELWRPKLDPAMKDIDQMLDACSQALMHSSAVNKDQAFMKTHFDAIQKLVKHVVTTQKKYADWRVQGRKLAQDADKAVVAVSKSNKEAESEVGALRNRIANMRKDTDTFEDDIAKWRKVCEDAAKSHNDKPAEAARLALLARIKVLDPIVKRCRADLVKLRKDFPDLPAVLAGQVGGMGDSLLGSENSLKLGMPAWEEFNDMKKKAMADKAEAPMIPKAELMKVAPLAGIDPKDSTKMALLHRMMNSTPHDKWAEQFVKLFKVKDGKDVVRKIDKLPYFVKQAHLIDI